MALGPFFAHRQGSDVRGFRTGRMSGARGRMSMLAWVFQMHSVMEGLDFRAKGDECTGLQEEPDILGDGRMSGLCWSFPVLSG